MRSAVRKNKTGYLGIRGDMGDMFVFDGGCYFRWGYKGRPLWGVGIWEENICILMPL